MPREVQTPSWRPASLRYFNFSFELTIKDVPLLGLIKLLLFSVTLSSVAPIFYYRIVINMIRCNFLQSLKKFCEGSSEPP